MTAKSAIDGHASRQHTPHACKEGHEIRCNTSLESDVKSMLLKRRLMISRRDMEEGSGCESDGKEASALRCRCLILGY